MKPFNIPPEITPVLAWWLPEVNKCLSKNIHSIMLFGSVVFNDFCPRWSDVDVCVVLKTPITSEDGHSIGNIHDRMKDRFIKDKQGSWESGQVIEGSYIPVELVQDENLKMPYYTAGGETREWAVGYPISPFDRYILAHFGHPIYGTPVQFKPPSRQSLTAQTKTDLGTLLDWNHKKRSAIWMAGMLHWAARTLVFWRDSKMLSKTAAMEQEIAKGSRFSTAFQLALTIRHRGSQAANEYLAELKKHYNQVAAELADEIEAEIRSGDHS